VVVDIGAPGVLNKFGEEKRVSITMRDVAEAAGVSIKTVSRVVNEQGEISEETRQRVLLAIEKLGYRPSKVARALVTNRTETIGLIVGDIANPYFSEVSRGVLDLAQEKGFDVFLCNSDGDLETEKRALFSLIDHNVDGAIIYPHWKNRDWFKDVSSPKCPVVLINYDLESAPGYGVVLSEIIKGAQTAVRYLIDKGHRHIGMLAGMDTGIHQRVQGYRKELKNHGLPFREDYILWGPAVLEHGIESSKALLTQHPEITALFCYNDLIAMGAIQGCKEMGLRVPEDCAIVGFDNIRFGALVCPSLTTIHCNKYEIGRQAASLLIEMLKSPDKSFPSIRIDSELIVRESA
jgi:LacI family transcriptional regulator